MQEYKREVKTLKEENENARQEAQYHHDHLRIIDSWFEQLLEEIGIVCNDQTSTQDPGSLSPFNSSLFTAPPERFEEHLQHKSEKIKSAIKKLFTSVPIGNADSVKQQEKIAQLLAAQKNHAIELKRLEDQRASLDERLENASMRYMMAEKKVDRLKSQPVQKLEAQAKQPPKLDADSPGPSKVKQEEPEHVNGVSLEPTAEADAARKAVIAERDTVRQQLDQLVEQNKKLNADLTSAQGRIATLSDEDYSHTELYRTLKSQHEDVIKRVNDLQAVHTHLRAEIKQLQTERTQFKEDVEKESENAIKESESQVTRIGLDLVRIRNERDNLHQDVAQARAERNETSESIARSAEIDAANKERIKSLEMEIERLQILAEEQPSKQDGDPAEMDAEALKSRLSTITKEKEMLMKELTSMESAYKKSINAASQKLVKTLDAEERVARANAEKVKADQKYFQTMKVKDAQSAEIKAVKAQNQKMSDIVSSLKESEGNKRTLVTQLEKQIADVRDTLAAVEKSHRDLQQREYDFKTKGERLAGQVDELKKQLNAKDEVMKTAEQNSRRCEAETTELKVRLEDAQKSVETWRQRSMGAKNDEYDMLKQIATCTICRKNFKEVALTKCGHVFCNQCLEERYQSRARKCPNCGLLFGQNDKLRVTL